MGSPHQENIEKKYMFYYNIFMFYKLSKDGTDNDYTRNEL